MLRHVKYCEKSTLTAQRTWRCRLDNKYDIISWSAGTHRWSCKIRRFHSSFDRIVDWRLLRLFAWRIDLVHLPRGKCKRCNEHQFPNEARGGKTCRNLEKHLHSWLCPSVCPLVCRSVTHSFNDPHGAPYWPTWPCFKSIHIQSLLLFWSYGLNNRMRL